MARLQAPTCWGVWKGMSPGVEGGGALAPKFWDHIQESVLDVGGTAYSCDLHWHSMGVVIGGHSFTEGVEGLTTRRVGGEGTHASCQRHCSTFHVRDADRRSLRHKICTENCQRRGRIVPGTALAPFSRGGCPGHACHCSHPWSWWVSLRSHTGVYGTGSSISVLLGPGQEASQSNQPLRRIKRKSGAS